MNTFSKEARLCALLIATSTSTQTLAQTAPYEDSATQGQLVEIIITAQRRTESLEKTSLVVDVVQGEALSNAGVTSALALTGAVPSLQIGSSGPNLSVFLRGVGSYASTAGQGPAVPFYIDGVYISRSQSIPSEFYDVDRLEVLKGPQGTLYGRNASGGAINIITKNPELGKWSGDAVIEGGNYGNVNGEVAANIPVGETAAVRVSGQVVDKDGYTSEGYGDDRHQSGRLKALWLPNADLSLQFNGSVGHVGGRGAAEVPLNRNLPGWYPWLDVTSPQVQTVYNDSPFNKILGACPGNGS